MKAMQKKTNNVVIHNETNWPVHRPAAAVLLQIWIIESFERINQHMVGVLLQIWNVLTSLFRTNWPVHSPVAAVLLHIWNRTKWPVNSRVAAAVLLQIWKTRSCRSGVAPDLAYLNFRQDSSWFSSPPVSQVSGLRSQTHFSDFIKFFLSFRQCGHFWNLINSNIQFYVWFLADQWGSVLGYSSIVYVSIDPYPVL